MLTEAIITTTKNTVNVFAIAWSMIMFDLMRFSFYKIFMLAIADIKTIKVKNTKKPFAIPLSNFGGWFIALLN